jgi:antitoxin Phd
MGGPSGEERHVPSLPLSGAGRGPAVLHMRASAQAAGSMSCRGRPAGWPGYPEIMSELPVDGTPGVAGAARDAARGHVVYLTERGERLAAIVPAEFAEALEGMSEQDARELLEDLADAAAAREALAEPGESVPWEQVRAEAGL